MSDSRTLLAAWGVSQELVSLHATGGYDKWELRNLNFNINKQLSSSVHPLPSNPNKIILPEAKQSDEIENV